MKNRRRDGGWILLDMFAGLLGVAAILVGLFLLLLIGMMIAA